MQRPAHSHVASLVSTWITMTTGVDLQGNTSSVLLIGSWPFILEKQCGVIPLKNKAKLHFWKQLASLLVLVWVQLRALNTVSRLPRYNYLILTKEGPSFSQWLPSLTSGNYCLLGSHSLQKVRGKSKNNLDNWASVWVPTPTDVGSSRVFQQIVGFSGEIIAYQELHALRDVTLLASSVQPQRRGKRENKRKNNPLNV